MIEVANPFEIMKVVEKYFHLKRGVLTQQNRTRTVAEARALAIYFTRQHTPYSWAEIGDHFEHHHATIMHAYRRIHQKIISNSNFYDNAVAPIKNILEAQGIIKNAQ